MTRNLTVQRRAEGALYGLALGDALGMPTQSMSRAAITERYGVISSLRDAVADQPIAPGMPAGAVTDDTEQAVLIAELLVSGEGHILPGEFASALIAWEESMIAKNSQDLLGPSTKAAIFAIQKGVGPDQSGRTGTTNGAAMRITPVGIAYAPGAALMRAVIEACQVTHNTNLGISGAAAIAGTVSASLDGAGFEKALGYGLELATSGEGYGQWIAGASIPRRFTALRSVASNLSDDTFADFLYEVVGTSVQSQESVVAALLIADRYRDLPFQGLCLAAQIGGDTDTVGAMAGAILGAHHGRNAFPAHDMALLEDVSQFQPAGLVRQLLELRAM